MNIHGIEKEIQSIPGNGPVLEELYKLLESGEAIALVGAGASAGLWPLWNEFLQGFIAHCLKSGKINSKEAVLLKAKKILKNFLTFIRQGAQNEQLRLRFQPVLERLPASEKLCR